MKRYKPPWKRMLIAGSAAAIFAMLLVYLADMIQHLAH